MALPKAIRMAILASLVLGGLVLGAALLRSPAPPAAIPSPSPIEPPSPTATASPTGSPDPGSTVPGQVLALEHVRFGPEIHDQVIQFAVVSADPDRVTERREVGGYTAANWTAISPDGSSVAYWRSRSRALTPPFELVIWDPVGAGGAVIHREDELGPVSLRWSTQGNELAFVVEGPLAPAAVGAPAVPRIFVMEPNAGTAPREVRRSDGLPHGGLLHYDGETVGTVRRAGPSPAAGLRYESIDARTGTVKISAPLDRSPEAVGPDGHMAGIAHRFEQEPLWMKVWEPRKGAEIAHIEIVGVNSPVFRPRSPELVFSVSGEIRAIDIGTQAIRPVFSLADGVAPVAFDPSGEYLLVRASRYSVLRAGVTYEKVADIPVPQSYTAAGWISTGAVSTPPPARQIARDLAEADAETKVGTRAREAVLAIRDRDMASLAQLAHPDKGVFFSPDANVDPRQDERITRAQLPGALADPAKRTWGVHDGIGGPIELSFAEYFEQFVYDRDFAAAPQVSYNRAIGSGNTTENTADMYPDAIMVEYHFPSSPNTLDWKSLRLLFEELDGTWYLVAIVHAEWTI